MATELASSYLVAHPVGVNSSRLMALSPCLARSTALR